MLVYELFENVGDHVAESELATIALREFRSQFLRNHDFKKSYLLSGKGLERIIIHPDFTKSPPQAGVASNGDYNIHVYFSLYPDYEKSARYIRSNKFESIFRHEFQHYLDHVAERFKGVERNHHGDEYVNSEPEYPAWFKQQAEPLLKILRAAKNNEPLPDIKIEPDFATFMRDGSHWTLTDINVPINDFNRKTKIRYLRDLAAVHKAVVAVKGASGSFRPKLITRLVIWLGKKFGITI